LNSLWNNNIALFRTRFPQLAAVLEPDIDSFEKRTSALFDIQQAKDGSPIAFENKLPLHSKYNPLREAEQLVSSYDATTFSAAAFLSFGLGYAPVCFATKFPSAPMVVVEHTVAYLLEAFSVLDWSAVLLHKDIVFAIAADAETTAAILDRYGVSSCKLFSVPAQTAHDTPYYTELGEILARHKQKKEINTNTLEKFSHLWLHNSCCNLHYLAELDGVEKYRNTTTLPFVILAAGPSLATILPHLAALKKHSVIVCVDTALHACLRAGVEPDFIILVDPQYACALHLEFLSSPSSVLITESAAYPSVFRFNCKEKVLCSSLFPIGQYFEKQLGNKGKLGAGGSVTTTAWDFARLCGTKAIYLAGMDLGFPNKQTHIRGSQFEERSHRNAARTASAETDTVSSLLGANPSVAKDYNGKPLLTDERMALFSWWFETNCKEAETAGVHTYTLTPQSLAIPGITPAPLAALLSPASSTSANDSNASANTENDSTSEADAASQRASFFANAHPAPHPQASFSNVLTAFEDDLSSLVHYAKKGISLCEQVFADRTRAPQTAAALEKLDAQILSSSGKDAASLVFPTERQLEKEACSLPADKTLHSFYYSRLIYQKLMAASQEYLSTLHEIYR
jgi:hypothetical protein